MTIRSEQIIRNSEAPPAPIALARRQFLKSSAALSGLSLLAAISPQIYAEEAQTPAHGKFELAPAEIRDFALLQLHLLPNDGNGPDAGQINATVYLSHVVSDESIDPVDRRFIKRGLAWMRATAQEQLNAEFFKLDDAQRESVLRQLEQSSRGESWLSVVIAYTLEALLSDPIYGGNPKEIGWRWLEHQAGFPRPSSETA